MTADQRPCIPTHPRDLAAQVEAAWRVVLAANDPPTIFAHDGHVVRVTEGVAPPLRGALHGGDVGRAPIPGFSVDSGQREQKYPPSAVVQAMLADPRGLPPLPILAGARDPVDAFFRHGCETGPGFTVGKGEIYEAYRGWCLTRTGADPLGRTKFYRRVAALRGVREARDGHWSVRAWSGIRVRQGEVAARD